MSLHCCGKIKEDGPAVLPSDSFCRKPLRRTNCSPAVMEQPFDFHQALQTGCKITHRDQMDPDATVILLLRSGRHSTAIPQKHDTSVMLT